MNTPRAGARSGAPSTLPTTSPTSPPTTRPRALVALLVAVLVAAGLVAGPGAGAVQAGARTWVVDAVDDAAGNRWEVADGGGSTVTIAPGDTVEWQFDAAQTNHDLTSEDTRSPWPQRVAHYATPGSAPYRVTFTEPGVYRYLCSVHGTTMQGTVVVQEPGAVNRAPVASPTLTPQRGTAPLVVHADAGASDPDRDPLTYAWDFGTHTDATDQATSAHAMWSYDRPGTYTVRLTVSDGRGGTAQRELPVVVESGDAPVVVARADTTSGPAPLTVAFTGAALDPQGGALRYSWDFGTAAAGDAAEGATAGFTYTEPGTYAATLSVTDPDGNTGTGVVDVVVTDPAAPQLPALTATATPRGGTGPLSVALSARTTTSGTFAAFADGLASYPGLAGTAELERRAGATRARIEVTGLARGAAHLVHVHERPCATEKAGAHFRFDRSQPFAETNEIWLPFTSDGAGTSGAVEVTQPLRADETAVSVVVHDPANPALRIGCADLAPSTAGLTYTWDLGDGSTATGPDPVHTYARPGTYTARVTVGGEHAGHTGGPVATAAVEVAVTAAPSATPPAAPPVPRVLVAPSGTVRAEHAVVVLEPGSPGAALECALDGAAWAPCAAVTSLGPLGDGPHVLQARTTGASGPSSATSHGWVVDTTGPRIRATRPAATTRDRLAPVRAVVADRWSRVARRSVTLRVDGRRVTGWQWSGGPQRRTVAWTPRAPLARGRHVARVLAADALGNRSVRTWRFHVE